MAQVSSFFSNKDQLKGFWEQQKNSKRKYKPGFLKTAKMSRMIDVFGEEIDMTVEQKGRKLEPLHAKCKNPENSKDQGYLPGPGLQEINNVKQLGFDEEGDSEPRDLKTFTPQLKTLSDFDNLYLGWMENYTFNDEKQKTLVKKAVRALFRFVFGTKAIQELQNTKDPRKLAELVRQVPLSPEEKAPCLNPKDRLWIWFKKSIEYRLQGLKCETVAASEALNREHQANPSALQNFFVKDLSVFYLNLYRFNEYLQRNNEGKEGRPCLDYTEPARGMGVEPVLDDNDYKRILAVFEEFLQDKYGKNKLYRAGDEADMKALTAKFNDSSFVVQKSALDTYKAIVALLQTSSVKSMKQQIEELKDETNMQELYSNILSMMLDSMQEEEQLRKTFEQFTSKLPAGSEKRKLWERVFGAKLSELDEMNRQLGELLRQKEAEYAKSKGTNAKGDEFLRQFVEGYASLRELIKLHRGVFGGTTGTNMFGGGSKIKIKINETLPDEDKPDYLPRMFEEINKLVTMLKGHDTDDILTHFVKNHPQVLDALAEAIRALQKELADEKAKPKTSASSAAPGLSSAEKAALEARLAKAQADLATVRSEKASVEATLASLRAEKDRLAAEKPGLEAARKAAEDALAAAKTAHANELAALRAEKDAEIATKQGLLDAATASVAQLTNQLDTARLTASAAEAASAAKIFGLEKEKDDALRDKTRLEEELAAAKEEATRLKDVEKQLEEANRKLEEAQRNAVAAASEKARRIAEIESQRDAAIAAAKTAAAEDAATKIAAANEEAARQIAGVQEEAALARKKNHDAILLAHQAVMAASNRLTNIASQLEVSADFEEIINEIKRLQGEVAEKDAALLANQTEIQNLSDEVERLKGAIFEANAAKDAAEAAQKAAEVAKESERAAAANALKEAQATAEREKDELKAANTVARAFIRNRLTRKIADLEGKLKTSSASLEEQKRKLEEQEASFQSQIDALTKELDEATSNLTAASLSYKQTLASKNEEIQRVGKQASNAESKTKEKEATIASLTAQIASLQSEKEPNEKKIAELRGQLAAAEQAKQAAEIRHGTEMLEQTKSSSQTIGKKDTEITSLKKDLDAARASADGQQATERNVASAREAQATAESQLAAAEAKVNILTAQLAALQPSQTSEEHPFEIPTSAIVPTSISQKAFTAASSMGRSGSGSGELPSSSSASSTSSGSSWTDSGKKFLIKGNDYEHILLLGYNYGDEIPPGIKTKTDAERFADIAFKNKQFTDFNILKSIRNSPLGTRDNIIKQLAGEKNRSSSGYLSIINGSPWDFFKDYILNFVLKSIIDDPKIQKQQIEINSKGNKVYPTKENIISYANNLPGVQRSQFKTNTEFQNAQQLNFEANTFFQNLFKTIKTIYEKPESDKPLYVKKYMGNNINPYTPTWGGGRTTRQTPSAKPLCELMLTYLFLQAKQSFPDFDAQEFLDKAGATLDDLGQCPLVLKVLNEMIDAAKEAHASNDINGPSFYNMNKAPLIENADKVEAAINSRFTDEEKQVLASMANPMTFYSKAPEEYEPILGTSPYFLTGRPAEELEEVELYGLDTEDPGPIYLTKDERAALEQDGQGVPLGALLFLYLQCLRDLQESGETPALNSKCPLLPNPKRSLSRSRTPKTKAKAKAKGKGPGTRKQTSH